CMPIQTNYNSFVLNPDAATYSYTLSLHDALPISIFTSTISASGATPKVAPAIAPATAVPCALQIFGSDGNAVYPIRTLPASSGRSEEHTSELQSLRHLVCRLLLEKKNPNASFYHI